MQTSIVPLVSVVIPAFNEESNIAGIIAQTEASMKTLNLPYEVIVINDGSNDSTKDKASGNGATVISYSTNRGKGYAIRRGLAKAQGQILVTIDADGSHNPAEIPLLVKPLLYGADVVIGSRFLRNNGKHITSKLNTIGNKLFNALILLLTRKKITDSQTGFRAFKRRVIHGIGLFSNGYEIESELTIKTIKNGFKVQEEHITCDTRKSGHSKLNPLRDGFAILKTILKATII